jgi:hypothetical protein
LGNCPGWGGLVGILTIPKLFKADQQALDSIFAAIVNINLPFNGAELPLDEPVSVYAKAVSGSPIHDLAFRWNIFPKFFTS